MHPWVWSTPPAGSVIQGLSAPIQCPMSRSLLGVRESFHVPINSGFPDWRSYPLVPVVFLHQVLSLVGVDNQLVNTRKVQAEGVQDGVQALVPFFGVVDVIEPYLPSEFHPRGFVVAVGVHRGRDLLFFSIVKIAQTIRSVRRMAAFGHGFRRTGSNALAQHIVPRATTNLELQVGDVVPPAAREALPRLSKDGVSYHQDGIIRLGSCVLSSPHMSDSRGGWLLHR